MDRTQLSKLLDSYINGTCTPEEIAIINNWYNQYQNTPDYTKALSDESREHLKRKMFADIAKATTTEDGVQQEIQTTRSITSYWWFRLAAAAIVILCVKFFLIDIHSLSGAKQTLSDEIRLVNQTHHIVKQTLSDGSFVWLTPGATLSYPKKFRAESRNVAMKGECFFEVTKNPSRPFIINSDHLVTKVWGTSFRVTDYSGAVTATVVVVTGKVSVSKKGSDDAAAIKLGVNEVLLHPKEEAIYHAEKNALVMDKKVDLNSLDIWKRIDLSFDNTNLRDIVNVLNIKFKANIAVKDDVLNKTAMTADLNDLNLPEVLEVLKTSLKLNYEVNGDHIILSKTN
jgi:ferric-dicitrate binding protein FerR (iron transport regulator)